MEIINQIKQKQLKKSIERLRKEGISYLKQLSPAEQQEALRELLEETYVKYPAIREEIKKTGYEISSERQRVKDSAFKLSDLTEQFNFTSDDILLASTTAGIIGSILFFLCSNHEFNFDQPLITAAGMVIPTLLANVANFTAADSSSN